MLAMAGSSSTTSTRGVVAVGCAVEFMGKLAGPGAHYGAMPCVPQSLHIGSTKSAIARKAGAVHFLRAHQRLLVAHRGGRPAIGHARCHAAGRLHQARAQRNLQAVLPLCDLARIPLVGDRKSTRLNSSHLVISYAVFCLKKKNKESRNPYRLRVRETLADRYLLLN